MIETQGPAQLRAAQRERVIELRRTRGAGRRAAAARARALIDAALAAQTLDDIGLMIYTSGSTGKPKGAMIS